MGLHKGKIIISLRLLEFYSSKRLLLDLTGEIVLTATYLINRLPSRVLEGVTLVQLMTTFNPSIPILTSLQSRVFGCPAFVHVHSPYRGKLDSWVIKCVFLCPQQKGVNVITLKVKKSMCLRMSPFMKRNPSFLVFSFRERVFKKLKSLSCHIFLCCKILLLRKMTKTPTS